jgi:N-methylhydantoinase A
MRTILVPPFAGVLSALGLAIAPERREAAASIMRLTSAIDEAGFADRLDAIGRSARGAMPSARLAWTARIRYAGQGHELDVPCTPRDDGDTLHARFTELHSARYSFTLESAVEVVAVRVAAIGEPVPVRFGPAGGSAAAGDERVVPGPHVETLPDATMVVAPGWTARTLGIGGWMMERDS